MDNIDTQDFDVALLYATTSNCICACCILVRKMGKIK
jgi:hypothetical protein